MIQQFSKNIDKTDIAFLRGYKASRKDSVSLAIDCLWEEHKRLVRAFPELAEGISGAIDAIEKKFSNDPMHEN